MLAYALFHPLKKITLWRVRLEAESNLIRWNCTATKVKIKKSLWAWKSATSKNKKQNKIKTSRAYFWALLKMAEGYPADSQKWQYKDINPPFFFCACSGPQRDRRQWRVSWSQNNAGSNVSLGKISSLAAEFSPFTSLISSIFLRQKVETHFLQSCFNLQYENGARA